MDRNARPSVAAVVRYSAAVLPKLLELGPVTSGLAPWMLAAALAPKATGATKDALTQHLGLDGAAARTELNALLDNGPVALRRALAFWRGAMLRTGGPLAAWEAELPAATAHGPMPTQAAADAWTREQTGDLIKAFPLDLTPDMVCVLAAAIMTRFSWDEPLDVVPAAPNDWGLKTMLSAGYAHGVYETKTAGLLGVATSGSHEAKISVYSVIGEPSTPRAALVKEALELARVLPTMRGPEPVSPSKLPKKGHCWTVGKGYGNSAVVPAFEARAEKIDITQLPGIADAAKVFVELATPSCPAEVLPLKPQAKMSAMARYHKLGFEAAAVAAMGALFGGMPQQRATVDLSFSRPHLMIAVGTEFKWAGLPLFAAWVDTGVREADA